ncbi:uncharacterized protein LOC131670509 [Phymastichus coffea]|uniref:uncharacterized protein LOC131670509 n=1 Tax=Phymastichus coffea TaxID=108790 RepID=UPI00273AD8B0|nr:uncharacterized protein LOC131670509 [Phymastichus coffea]
MSCIKFPSSKADLLKSSNKENIMNYNTVNSQLIKLANEVFGEDNWSHSVSHQSLDYVDYVAGKYQAGCSSIVRVQLQSGNFHEDVGYSCTESSSKGSAIHKARMGSCNIALKRALMCFGKDIKNKINKLPSQQCSPMQIEKYIKQIDPPQNLLLEDNVQSNTFEDCIPLSQAEALMDAAAFDQIFDKDQNSNNLDLVKSDKSKENSISNGINEELRVGVSEPITSTASVVHKEKVNINNGVKTDIKTEESKLVISTVMTEEEMRLDRKRRQREMQEEFKRKQESKKKKEDNGNKPTPNSRY